MGLHELRLHLRAHGFIEVRDLEEIPVLQHVPRYAHLFGDEPHRGDPAALPVPAIVHLLDRAEDVVPPHGDRGREAHDPAPAFVLRLHGLDGRFQIAPRADDEVCVTHHFVAPPAFDPLGTRTSRSVRPRRSLTEFRFRRARTSRSWSCHARYMFEIRCAPHSGWMSWLSSGSVGVVPHGQPRPDSQFPQRTQPTAMSSAVPRMTPSAPRAIAFAASHAVRIPPLAIRMTSSRIPSFSRNLWTFGTANSIGIAMFFFEMSGAAPVPPYPPSRWTMFTPAK